MKQFKTILQYALIIAIGAWFLYFVFKGTNWNELKEKFAQADYSWIVIGMSIAMISHFLRGYRAVMLYEPMGYRIPVKNSIYAVLIGYMMNYLIPRAGEVSRCAALNKSDSMPVDKSLGTVVAERAFDMLILLLLLAGIFIFRFNLLVSFIQDNSAAGTQDTRHIKLIIVTFLAFGAIAAWLLRKRLLQIALVQKILKLLRGFTEGLLSIRKVKKPVTFIVLSFSIWACYVLMMYFCLFALKSTASVSFEGCLIVFAIGTIGVVIPAPAAGAGTYHFFVIHSLMIFGVPEEDGKAYAIIVHGAQMILLLLAGAVSSVQILLAARKKQAIENEPAK